MKAKYILAFILIIYGILSMLISNEIIKLTFESVGSYADAINQILNPIKAYAISIKVDMTSQLNVMIINDLYPAIFVIAGIYLFGSSKKEYVVEKS
jgi:hypothetical protein